MLETVIKTLLVSMVISFFFIQCLRVIEQSASNALVSVKHSSIINELNNKSFSGAVTDGFRVVVGNGSLVVCKPELINNHPGSVCLAP